MYIFINFFILFLNFKDEENFYDLFLNFINTIYR